jgi:hypothetical protein
VVALFTVVGENGSLCDLRHLSGEGVHWRPEGVGALPFCVVAGVQGAVEVAIGNELMLGSYGGGKMNRVRLDWVQGGPTDSVSDEGVGEGGLVRLLALVHGAERR